MRRLILGQLRGLERTGQVSGSYPGRLRRRAVQVWALVDCPRITFLQLRSSGHLVAVVVAL